MANEITLDVLKGWMTKTGSRGTDPNTFGDDDLSLIGGGGSDPEYERFARMLVRGVIGNAIAKMEEPNAPTSVLKIAFPIDYEIELLGPSRAEVRISCCGRGCVPCKQQLTIT